MRSLRTMVRDCRSTFSCSREESSSWSSYLFCAFRYVNDTQSENGVQDHVVKGKWGHLQSLE